MKRFKCLLLPLALVLALLAIFFVLKSEEALITHPKGVIAEHELKLIAFNIALMLLIVIPTFIVLFIVVHRYQEKNAQAKYDPEHTYGVKGQILLWVLPSIIIAVMVPFTWIATHKLDPFQPLESDQAPLTIQVVALDWKWLFIYPEQGIATLNLVQFPEKRTIHFNLSADGTPMNSFWIPELSGQIYAMTGMTTSIHMMAHEPGTYTGRAAEINGEGYADMDFVAKSMSASDFDKWVAFVKQSPLHLNAQTYNALTKPSLNNPPTLYSEVEPDLYKKIIMKYMSPI